jgi:four helix bundle protein
MSEQGAIRNYEAWSEALPNFIKSSPAWRLRVYRDALFVFYLAKFDVQRLKRTLETRAVVPQLFRATGSIGANIVEGTSRSSSADRKRFLEYALGSAREADHWYSGCDHVLGESVTNHRRTALQRICAQLVTLIPTQYNLRENQTDYDIGEG